MLGAAPYERNDKIGDGADFSPGSPEEDEDPTVTENPSGCTGTGLRHGTGVASASVGAVYDADFTAVPGEICDALFGGETSVEAGWVPQFRCSAQGRLSNLLSSGDA